MHVVLRYIFLHILCAYVCVYINARTHICSYTYTYKIYKNVFTSESVKFVNSAFVPVLGAISDKQVMYNLSYHLDEVKKNEKVAICVEERVQLL